MMAINASHNEHQHQSSIAAVRNAWNMFEQLKRELPILLSTKKINKNEFKARQQRLHVVQEKLRYLEQYLVEKKNLTKEESDLGLPRFEALSDQEMSLVDAMFTQRLFEVKEVFKEFKELASYAKEAVNGDLNSFRGVMRLAKFKKSMQEFEAADHAVRKKLVDQELVISKLGAMHRSGGGAKHSDNNLKSLMRIFEHISRLSQRIGRSREKIERESQRVQRMEEWIHNVPPSVHINHLQPPTEDDLRRASEVLKKSNLDPLDYSRQRLTIARDFAKACRQNIKPEESLVSEINIKSQETSKRSVDQKSVIHMPGGREEHHPNAS